MSSPSVWGPPIWILFHTMAEKINEEVFNKIIVELFNWIKRICAYLPCPDCSKHASHFLAKINRNQISNKTDFKNMLYIFHNVVNTRKTKPLFNSADMVNYSKNNVIIAYNNFASVYNTKGNMQLLTESFQRQLIIKDFKQWIMNNVKHFQ